VIAFYVLGSAFVLWALTLTAIGVRRDGFPRSRRQTVAVGTLSVLLAASAIGSAIITTALEHHGGGEAHAAPRGGGGGQRLALRADPTELRFDKSELAARAGRVTIVMTNPSQIGHNVSLEGDGHGATVGNGGTSTVSAELKPGRYTYYCSVPGHRAAGMHGTLTVR
jgi:plastocyanin